MGAAFINNGAAQTPSLSGGSGAITSAIDMTGATFFSAVTVGNDFVSQISDSQGLTWVSHWINPTVVFVQAWYAVGAGDASHVFTADNAPRAAAIAVMGFSGVDQVSPGPDGENDNTGTGIVATGNFTPSSVDTLVTTFSAIRDTNGNPPAGYTLADYLTFISGQAYAVASAWKIFSGSPGTLNPSWTGFGDTFAVGAAGWVPEVGVNAGWEQLLSDRRNRMVIH